ncbi:MAG: cytochrome-c oxidase, cbb3-type subunit III [Gammaproteobacteria bacterium]|jgi:cytochrome c oxidase cbb3-type subunit 3
MSASMGWFVAVTTILSLAACIWLIAWTMRRRPGEAAETETTHHVWDGDLQEMNRPLPRWWLMLFYLTILFAGIYLALYPGLVVFDGLLGWSQTEQYEKEIRTAEARYAPIFEAFAARPIAELANDPEALQVGRNLYANHCAMCHGSAARGAASFPNLTDDDWLYGGDPQSIRTSILQGRQGVMPAWASSFTEDELDAMVGMIRQLGTDSEKTALESPAGQKFQMLCAACHGPNGRGNQALGAPNLADDIWLYGGSREAIIETIVQGRQGVMPAHEDLLGENRVHVLAAYVYSLSRSGGGAAGAP